MITENEIIGEIKSAAFVRYCRKKWDFKEGSIQYSLRVWGTHEASQVED
jgi:hypothetical protein